MGDEKNDPPTGPDPGRKPRRDSQRVRKVLSERLRAARRASTLTPEDAARATGLSTRSIHLWESGEL